MCLAKIYTAKRDKSLTTVHESEMSYERCKVALPDWAADVSLPLAYPCVVVNEVSQ